MNQDREVAEENFPIVVGGSPTADIILKDLEAHVDVAYIGLADGHPFVQAAESETSVWFNDKRLQGSVWLYHGDTLRVGSYRIRMQVEKNEIVFHISESETSQEAPSPIQPSVTGETIRIEPISFRSQPRGRRSKSVIALKWLGGIALTIFFVALSVSIWFVFTAKQVVIRIDPQPDRVSIFGSLAAPRIGNNYLLRSGNYILEAEKACYQPLRHQFRVSEAKSQKINLKLAKLEGRISIQAHSSNNPSQVISGAKVYIDRTEVGVTPLGELPVAAGLRHLTIAAQNFQEFDSALTIRGCDELQAMNIALVPDWSDIKIISIPPVADVHIDGKLTGRTPLKLQLSAGTYQIKVSADRYKTWMSELLVQPNQPQVLDNIRLQPADAILTVQTDPAGANVMIDNRYIGQTPVKTQISPDTRHKIQITKAGYENAFRKIQLASASSKKINVTLKPLMGVIYLNVEPDDAELVIDGKLRGKVPPELRLVAIEHHLEIRKNGYRSQHTRITPRPGFAQKLNITLKPEAPEQTTPRDIIHAKNGYTLKLIPPGVFTMGSSRREQGRRSNETLRKIELKRPFYMGLKEITNEEFKKFLATHNSGTFKQKSLNQNAQPVVQITWEQAVLFCNWLSAQDSLPPAYLKKGDHIVAAKPLTTGYRLPTEAEWEYCARYANKGATQKYPWGNKFPPEPNSGNFADNSAKDLLNHYMETYNDGYPVSAPPAEFKANKLGLFDFGGNVAEWSHDFYTIYPYDAQKVFLDPIGPPQGKHHSVRGSSWKHASLSVLRLAYRDYSSSKRNDLGFRICRYVK
ncbi:MAG: PEGA domain-containing protein [Desulfobacterales bacterium]|jgi:formylglycine-generating enzyme required for sulfatase activity